MFLIATFLKKMQFFCASEVEASAESQANLNVAPSTPAPQQEAASPTLMDIMLHPQKSLLQDYAKQLQKENKTVIADYKTLVLKHYDIESLPTIDNAKKQPPNLALAEALLKREAFNKEKQVIERLTIMLQEPNTSAKEKKELEQLIMLLKANVCLNYKYTVAKSFVRDFLTPLQESQKDPLYMWKNSVYCFKSIDNSPAITHIKHFFAYMRKQIKDNGWTKESKPEFYAEIELLHMLINMTKQPCEHTGPVYVNDVKVFNICNPFEKENYHLKHPEPYECINPQYWAEAESCYNVYNFFNRSPINSQVPASIVSFEFS